jgi:hypothetical protein
MKYTVVWRPKAEARLAELWMAAADRNEVAQASDDFDRLVAHNPSHRAQTILARPISSLSSPWVSPILCGRMISSSKWRGVWRYQPVAETE